MEIVMVAMETAMGIVTKETLTTKLVTLVGTTMAITMREKPTRAQAMTTTMAVKHANKADTTIHSIAVTIITTSPESTPYSRIH